MALAIHDGFESLSSSRWRLALGTVCSSNPAEQLALVQRRRPAPPLGVQRLLCRINIGGFLDADCGTLGDFYGWLRFRRAGIGMVAAAIYFGRTYLPPETARAHPNKGGPWGFSRDIT